MITLSSQRARPFAARRGTHAGPVVAAGNPPDTLTERQALDAVDVPGPLAHQDLTFPTVMSAVFLFARRRTDDGADPRCPAFERQQGTDQHFEVETIRLRTPMLAGNHDRRRIDDVTLYPVLPLQRPVDPEAIQAGFLDDHQREEPSLAGAGPLAQSSDAGEEARNVAAL